MHVMEAAGLFPAAVFCKIINIGGGLGAQQSFLLCQP